MNTRSDHVHNRCRPVKQEVGMNQVICHCMGLQKQTLEQHLREMESPTLESLILATGAATACRTCLVRVRTLVDEETVNRNEESEA